MIFNILSGQVIKTKKYTPNPVVKFGIPAYADALQNPKVIDTLAYQQYWEEQLYYIHNGYQAGGLYIPGRYYKFVNFDMTQTSKGVSHMEIHDYQLDFALWIEHLKSPGIRKNGYIPKARRKALSVMTVGMIIDYGFRFKDNYRAAVVAGLDEYSQDFIAKWKFVNMHMIKEFRVKTLKSNDDEIVAGWKEQTPEGWVDAGSMNTIYIRTVNNDSNVLKGKSLSDIVYEESGENELLLETIAASEDCLRAGSVQYGSSWIYGTGGMMSKGSKGFKEVHMKPHLYNVEQFYVPAYVFLDPAYAGATNEYGDDTEDIPNLQYLQPYERVGWSDFERAKIIIKNEQDRLLAEGDMDKYIKYCQNNPISIEEIFRTMSSNNFDIIKINHQLYEIESAENKRYNLFHLSYKKNPETGNLVTPLEIEIRPATNNDPEYECVYILNDGHPIKSYRDLDVAGCDSYDQNQSRTSKSLGAMVVFRRMHNIPDIPAYLPIALVRIRPKYKEQFYDLCIKVSIYYNLLQNVLIDAGKPGIIQHFKDTGNERFLAKRPRKFESPSSQQTHDYGVLLTGFSRPLMGSALQTLFDFHIEKVWFPDILKEALNWDSNQKPEDSDNDTVDALGIAIMRAIDMEDMPLNEEELLKGDPWAYPEWKEDAEGNIVEARSSEFEDDKPLGIDEDIVSRHHRRIVSENNEQNDEDGIENNLFD